MQMLLQDVGRRASGLRGHAEHPGDPVRHQLGLGQPGQRHEGDGIGMRPVKARCHFDGEPGLADARRPDERHQPMLAQERCDRLDRIPPPDEARKPRRQGR